MSFLISLYLLSSLFLFEVKFNFKSLHLPFFSTILLLNLFLEMKDKIFNIFSFFLSLSLIYFSLAIYKKNFFIPFIFIFLLWANYKLLKEEKLLFILHLFLGFFLFLTISSIGGFFYSNFLISLHFSLPFSLILINKSLYKEKETEFPFGHLISVLFGLMGIGFVILKIYSIYFFIPLFVLLSVSIYAFFYQPPFLIFYYKFYQICFFASILANYIGLKLNK